MKEKNQNVRYSIMRSIRDFTDSELLDRISFIEEEENIMSGEEWDREWKSEYMVAVREFNRRKEKSV